MPENFNAGGIYASVNLNMQPFMAGMNQYRSLLGQMDAETGRRFKSMESAVTAAMVAMSSAVVAASVAVGKAIFESASKAVDSENLFEVSFGNMATAARTWSESFASSLGLNDYAVRQSMAVFNSFIQNMGIGTSSALEMSQSLTSLGYDLQSAFGNALGLTIEQTFEKLRSGLRGETEAIEVFGVNLLESNVKAYAYANGIAKVGEQLSEVQKIQSRYGIIMQQTAMVQGDYARTIDSPANKLVALKQQMEKTRIELGMAFLPLFSRGLTSLTGFAKAVGALTSTFAKLPEPLKMTIGLSITLGATLVAVTAAASALGKAYKSLTGDVIDNTKAVGANIAAQKLALEAQMAQSVKSLETIQWTRDHLTKDKWRYMSQMGDYLKTLESLDVQEARTKLTIEQTAKALKTLEGGLDDTGKAATGAAGGLRIFGATGLAALGWIALITVGVAALTTGIWYLATMKQREYEANQKTIKQNEQQSTQVKDLVRQYQDLNSKENKTAEDKQKILDVQNKIAKIMPQAIKGWDDEGNALIDLNKVIDETIRLKKESLELNVKNIDSDLEKNAKEQKRLQEKINNEMYGRRPELGGAYRPVSEEQEQKDSIARTARIDNYKKQLMALRDEEQKLIAARKNALGILDKGVTLDDVGTNKSKNDGDDSEAEAERRRQARLDAIRRFADQYAQEMANASERIELQRKKDLEEVDKLEKDEILTAKDAAKARWEINQTYDHQQLMLKQQFDEQMRAEYLQLTEDLVAIEEDRYQRELQLAKENGASVEQVEQNHQLRLKKIKEDQDTADAERQRRINDYNNQFLKGKEKERQEIEDWFNEQKKIAEELNQDVAPLYEEYYARLNRLNAGWKEGLLDGLQEIKEEINDTYGRGKQMAHDIADGFTDMGRVVVNDWMDIYESTEEYQEALTQSMKQWAADIVAEYMDLLMKMFAKWLTMKIMGVFNPAGMAGGQSVGSAGAAAPAAPAPIPGRASGGPVLAGKTYLVGERGPELFNSPYSGTITPNNQLGQGAMNIKFEVKNATGQDIKVSQDGEPKMEFDTAVIGIIIDAYARDRNGIRTMMKGGLG